MLALSPHAMEHALSVGDGRIAKSCECGNGALIFINLWFDDANQRPTRPEIGPLSVKINPYSW